MKFRKGRPANVTQADYTRRIVVTPNGLEFLDQEVTLVQDIETQEEVEVEHGNIGFLTAKLEDAWDVEVEIPVNPGPQSTLPDGTVLIDPLPEIPWGDGPVPAPTAPKLRLTVGQAITALTVYADTLRPPTPE